MLCQTTQLFTFHHRFTTSHLHSCENSNAYKLTYYCVKIHGNQQLISPRIVQHQFSNFQSITQISIMDTTYTSQHEMECRICRSGEKAGLIVSPCLCKGSMGYVHCQCLEEWLNVSSRTNCNICSFAFTIIRVRQYTWQDSLRVWFSKPENIRYLYFDLAFAFITILLMLQTLIIWSHDHNNLITLIKAFARIVRPLLEVLSCEIYSWSYWWSTCYRIKLLPTNNHEANITTV